MSIDIDKLQKVILEYNKEKEQVEAKISKAKRDIAKIEAQQEMLTEQKENKKKEAIALAKSIGYEDIEETLENEDSIVEFISSLKSSIEEAIVEFKSLGKPKETNDIVNVAENIPSNYDPYEDNFKDEF